MQLYLSVQKDEIYCVVGASEKRLMEEADRTDYDLQLDKDACVQLSLDKSNGVSCRLLDATVDPDVKEITEDIWYNLYGKYDQAPDPSKYLEDYHRLKWRQGLYYRYNTEDENHPRYMSLFKSTDRIKLMFNIIEADEEVGGASISITKRVADDKDSMLAFFPLHEKDKRKQLMDKWFRLSSTFWGPLDDIRDYLGEQIAFYFAFLSFYNRSLVSPSLIGLGFFVWQIIAARIDVSGIAVYAFVIIVWSTIFLELWGRKEARYRIRWGMTKFAEKEQPRPEFQGEWKPSEVDGRREEQFDNWIRLKRQMFSQTVIWTLIGVVLAAVFGIFAFRKYLQTDTSLDENIASYLTAFINAIQIQLLNFIYAKVSVYLNDNENYRTDSEFENAMIAKTFLFKFVNSYNSLFYIAFLKRHDDSVGGCRLGNSYPDQYNNPNDPGYDPDKPKNPVCLRELQQQLATIFITLIVVNNALEVILPMVMSYKAARDNRQIGEDGKAIKPSRPEKEYELAPYDSTFDDMDELVVQFGYATMFSVAFPLAPLCALLNNVFETRIDATKVCLLSRRAEPKGAVDIGTWKGIMNIMSFISVIVNVGLICFTSERMIEWSDGDVSFKYLAFIASEHAFFLVKAGIAYYVPDEPEDYNTHVRRQQYVVDVLLSGMDEPDDPTALGDEIVISGNAGDFDWGRVADVAPVELHDLDDE